MEDLFVRFLNNECSKMEIELLLKEFEAGDNEILLRTLIRNHLESTVNGETSQYAQTVEQVYASLEGNIHGSVQRRKATIVTLYKKMGIRIAAAAACLAFVLFAAWKWWPADSGKEQEIVYQQQLVTQMGSRSQVLLPDGSKVWLNAGSQLDYPKQFNGKTRDVQLQGEAYFEVMKDSEKPFFVHTSAFDIKVLGTGFNVRAYTDEDSAVTALVHGSVEVIVGKNEKRTILLSPNEKITLPTNSGIDELAKEINNNPGVSDLSIVKEKMVIVEDTVQSETAWVNNKLAFKKTPLENVALVLEKWFGTEIRFKNEDKKALNLSGVYDGENLDEILSTLGIAGPFHYHKDNNGVIWIE